MNPLELAHTIVNALEDKKGENLVLMDLQKVASFTDFFVLCTGTSDRMLMRWQTQPLIKPAKNTA